MWTYWRLLEGEVYWDEPYLTAAGLNPPVLHVESSEPIVDPVTGREIKDYTYVYFKNGNERMDRPGLQGGTVPVKLGPVAVTDPYGHANDDYQADAWFARFVAMAERLGGIRGARIDARGELGDDRVVAPRVEGPNDEVHPIIIDTNTCSILLSWL